MELVRRSKTTGRSCRGPGGMILPDASVLLNACVGNDPAGGAAPVSLAAAIEGETQVMRFDGEFAAFPGLRWQRLSD